MSTGCGVSRSLSVFPSHGGLPPPPQTEGPSPLRAADKAPRRPTGTQAAGAWGVDIFVAWSSESTPHTRPGPPRRTSARRSRAGRRSRDRARDSPATGCGSRRKGHAQVPAEPRPSRVSGATEPESDRNWVGLRREAVPLHLQDSAGTPREPRPGTLHIFGTANRRCGGNAESDRRRYRRDSALKPRLRAGFVRFRRPVMTWTRRSSCQSPTSYTSPPRRRPRPSAFSPP
jgi:hypothetical protein